VTFGTISTPRSNAQMLAMIAYYFGDCQCFFMVGTITGLCTISTTPTSHLDGRKT
jgi:hypothetical protein